MQMRSPIITPPVNGLEGCTATMPTRKSLDRNCLVKDCTKEPAATNSPTLIRAPCTTVACIPIIVPSTIVHAWISANWPIDRRVPIYVPWPKLATWIIVPSWTWLFSPMRILSISPRSSQLYQIPLTAPILISPMLLAVGAIKAELEI